MFPVVVALLKKVLGPIWERERKKPVRAVRIIAQISDIFAQTV